MTLHTEKFDEAALTIVGASFKRAHKCFKCQNGETFQASNQITAFFVLCEAARIRVDSAISAAQILRCAGAYA